MTKTQGDKENDKASIDIFSSLSNRRDFLSWLTVISLSAAGFFFTAVLTKFAFPPRRSLDGKMKMGWLHVAGVEDLTEGKPKLVAYGEDWAYLIKTAGKITAYNTSCPHVGCKLRWNEKTKRFDCPCHGSSFNLNGRRLGGPAPRDMFVMSLKVRDGRVWIEGTENAT